MDKFESYTLLFTDSLMGNLAFNPSSEFVVHSMKAFANYDVTIMFLIVLGASFFSITSNYYLGKVLKTILHSSTSNPLSTQQKNISAIFNKYNILFLALSVVPFCGKFVQVVAGVFEVKYIRVIAICMLFKTIYYVVVLFLQ